MKLRCQIAQVAAEHDARGGRQQAAILFGHPVGAQQKDAARLDPSSRPTELVDEIDKKLLHLIEVLRGMLVQDDEIRVQPLDTPVFLGVQQLPHQRQTGGLADSHQHDRQIA